MIWFLTHWKQVLIGSLLLTWTGFVWQAHTWLDAYRNQYSEIKAIHDLGNGAAKIVEDNQQVHKELIHENCAVTAHSSNLGKLLY